MRAQEKPSFPVGKIVGLYGLKGAVKIRPSTNKPELLLGLTRVLTRETRTVPAQLLEIEEIHLEKRLLWAYFAGYSDRSSVEILVGAELLGWESELGELDEEEFWVRDLVGMDVFTTEGHPVGRIVAVMPGASDILEIRRESDPPGRTILVPFVKDLVPTVSMAGRRVEVVNLPGLLEAQ